MGGGGNRRKKEKKNKGKRDSPAPQCLPKDLIEFRDFPPASFSNSSLLLLGKTRLGVLPELWEEPRFHSVGGLEHTSLLPRQQTSSQIPPTAIAWTLKALLLFKLGWFFSPHSIFLLGLLLFLIEELCPSSSSRRFEPMCFRILRVSPWKGGLM